jgi:heme/copper-type cytochrome/quinol oxidase subunit 3
MSLSPYTRRPRLDVSTLPGAALDSRSPIWWGNLMLLFIETSMIAILVSSYFYMRLNFHAWPPPRVEGTFNDYNPVPLLKAATCNVVLLLVSFIPQFLADRSALKMRLRPTQVGLVLVILCGAAAIWLRFHEFTALKFRWDTNAYGSIVWAILLVHLLHLIAGSLENSLMLVWTLVHGLDDKHARDIRVNAVYWYWIIFIWIPLYTIVFLGPRWY